MNQYQQVIDDLAANLIEQSLEMCSDFAMDSSPDSDLYRNATPELIINSAVGLLDGAFRDDIIDAIKEQMAGRHVLVTLSLSPARPKTL